jgi:4-amino-4-deoxychorismate lyase
MTEVIGCWIDGEPGSTLPLDDRGLQYGDGLFETVLLRNQRARFLELHLARLAAGCARLGIAFEAMDALRTEILRVAARAPALAILKCIVTRGSARRRGYAAPGGHTPRRMVTLFETSPVPENVRHGAVLRVATLHLAAQPALAGIKHLNRLENVLAASEPGHAQCFDSLLLDEAGQLVGGTMTNVFAVHGNQLLTPAVDRCGVAGVMRAVVMREAAALGLAVTQGRLTLAELQSADEAFVTNARTGVVRVGRVGEHGFRMNTVTRKLADHIEALDA